MSNSNSILLVIEDSSFFQSVQEKTTDCTIYFAQDIDEARKLLRSKKYDFSGIFINPDLSDQQGVTLLKDYFKNRPSVPIYLITDQLEKLGKGITKEQVGVHGLLKSPKDVYEVIKIIQIRMKEFDHQQTLDKSSRYVESSGDVLKEADRLFVPIRARNFVCGHHSYFDVYIRLSRSKYVKIINAGEEFELDRLQKYLKKGLRYFYIRKGVQENYLDFCDKLSTAILESKNFAADVKIEQILNCGQETISFLKNQGLDQESITYAQNYAVKVIELVDKLKDQNKILVKFIKNIANYEHSAGTAIFAGLLGREMGLENQERIEVLGLAALLHDIGLNRQRTLYDEGDLTFLDEESIEEVIKSGKSIGGQEDITRIYDEHTRKGAELVSSLKGVSPVVSQIIYQHHQRMDNSGFPKRMIGEALHPLSQVVAICDEFSKMIRLVRGERIAKHELNDFLTMLSGMSEEISKLFLKVFMP